MTKPRATARGFFCAVCEAEFAGAQAALAEVCAAVAAFSRASLARICDSVSCTWLSKTYCAGRWFSIGISGAIGPLVLTPRQAIASALSGCFIMALAAVVDHPAVARGIAYLTAQQGADGFWNEPRYTATGFPRVFYLRYHGYAKFFPLWALARYRNLKSRNVRGVAFGM